MSMVYIGMNMIYIGTTLLIAAPCGKVARGWSQGIIPGLHDPEVSAGYVVAHACQVSGF